MTGHFLCMGLRIPQFISSTLDDQKMVEITSTISSFLQHCRRVTPLLSLSPLSSLMSTGKRCSVRSMLRRLPLLLKMEATAELSSLLPSFTNFLSLTPKYSKPLVVLCSSSVHTHGESGSGRALVFVCMCVRVSPSGSCTAESKHVIGLQII